MNHRFRQVKDLTDSGRHAPTDESSFYNTKQELDRRGSKYCSSQDKGGEHRLATTFLRRIVCLPYLGCLCGTDFSSICKPFVYTMDPQPEEGFLLPHTTMGHEAAAYLTYIVTNYDQLPPYTIFVHANDDQWHNELFGPKTTTALRFLRYESVDANGFVNLRCTGIPGCPNTLIPVHREPVDDEYAYVSDKFFELYSYLLQVPMDQVPQVVGHLCCGQFVVTRNQIRSRPREDYERILTWAATTDFTDSYGIGWTIEKIWHVLFGREPVE